MFNFWKKKERIFNNVGVGKLGEKLAKKYLKKQGYKILDKNFYTRYGEIDLIALKDNTLIFFEIKTRTNQSFGYPEEAINYKKQGHLKKAAEIYLFKKGISNKDLQIDVLSIELGENKRKTKIRHLENI